MFIGRLPFGSVITGSKAIFTNLVPKQVAHPFVMVDNLFLIGCSPEYIDRYFHNNNFQIQNVWFHTTIPNYNVLLRRFNIQPTMHILDYEYSTLPSKYKQKYHIQPTSTLEVIINALI